MDHDQRFKALIREFFGDFLTLFFADWAAKFDLNSVQWLDKEVMPEPPEGSRHQLDLVAKLRTRERVASSQSVDSETWLALIHIEIESPDHTTELKPRLPRYYIHLREQHELPVLPIVIYLKVSLEGIGVDVYEECFGDLCCLRFQYLYVGLPGLNAVEYVHGENWLGVALSALMKIPREQVLQLGTEALGRLAAAPLNDQQRFLLADCVEAYLPLGDEQQKLYEQIELGSSQPKVKAMNQTTYDRGLHQGIFLGRAETLHEVILRLGRKRLGEVPDAIRTALNSIQELPRLKALVERTLEVKSWAELLETK